MKFSLVWKVSLLLVVCAVPSVSFAAEEVAFAPIVGINRISKADVPIKGGLANMFILIGIKKEDCGLGTDKKYVEATVEQKEAFIAAFGAQKIADDVTRMKKISRNPDVTTVFLFVKTKDKPTP